MYRGDTPTIDIAVFADDGVTPFDLTGCSVWYTAKRNKNDADADAVIQCDTTNGQLTITNPTAGLIEAVPLASDTASLTELTNLWDDVQVRTAADRTYTVYEGMLQIRLDVTRS